MLRVRGLSVVRLRRTPLTFFTWGVLTVPFAFVALVSGLASVVEHSLHAGNVLLISVGSFFLALWLSSRVTIEDGMLHEGLFFRPRSIALEEIVDVRRGRVGWGQSLVDGIVVYRSHSDAWACRMLHSQFLTRERTDLWIAEILRARDEHMAQRGLPEESNTPQDT